MIPNRCAKTRVQLSDDTVLPVYSCFVDRPDALSEDQWVRMDDVLVDTYSREVLGWHDVGWIMQDDTILAAKVEGDIDPRVDAFVKETRALIAQEPLKGETKEVTTAPQLSGSIPQESKEHTSTTPQSLEDAMETLSVTDSTP
tara:strand:+ start:8388 stop:8816 length:429 start_codon:yes stop_codon:yes gene_type:complete